MIHYLKILAIITFLSSNILNLNAKPSELTFELPDGQNFCLHEQINLGNQIKFKYQVLQGGNLDIDFYLITPKEKTQDSNDYDDDILEKIDSSKIVIYSKKRLSAFANQITADQTGEYSFCFSNKFSSFTHKIVYIMIDTNFNDSPDDSNAMAFFDDLSEEEKKEWENSPLFDKGKIDNLKDVAFQKTEDTLAKFHTLIDQLEELQTDFRNKHFSHYKFSQTLSEKVNHWGLFQFLTMLAIVILQVLTIRSFFIEKRVNLTKINESNSREQKMDLIARKRNEAVNSRSRDTGNPNTRVFKMSGGSRPGLPT